MILITGGAYQGKTVYAKENFPDMQLINTLHIDVKKQMKKGKNPCDEFNKNIKKYKNTVIVCDDIFCGVVPIDKDERLYREELARVLCLAATHSEQVIRIFCGLPLKIKPRA